MAGKVLDPAWGHELMECECLEVGLIEAIDAGPGFIEIRCASCDWTMRLTHLACVGWAFRATELDPEGELEKLPEGFTWGS